MPEFTTTVKLPDGLMPAAFVNICIARTGQINVTWHNLADPLMVMRAIAAAQQAVIDHIQEQSAPEPSRIVVPHLSLLPKNGSA